MINIKICKNCGITNNKLWCSDREDSTIILCSKCYREKYPVMKKKRKTRKDALLAEDGESLYSKYCKGEITGGKYKNEQVKKKGFNNQIEYQNDLVKKRGFENRNEYQNKMIYKRSDTLPMSENKECASYLGIYIAEEILPLIFDDVVRMPDGHKDYDFICIKGYKIQVKSSCLRNIYDKWIFMIRKNKIADYFFMVAFDNRDDLNVLHMWLIKGDENIKTNKFDKKLNERVSFTIINGEKLMKRYIKYEIIDKLDEVQKVCDEFKKNLSVI